MSEKREPSPLFVFGCYRSGTSLLRLMLNAHSQISIPEETQYIPIIGRKIEQYGDLAERKNCECLVTDILCFLKKRTLWNITPDLDGVCSLLPESPQYSDVIRSISVLAESKKDIRYWGDKTPSYVGSAFYLSSLFPDAKFINVIRDGRDVAASVLSEPKEWGLTIYQIAEEWARKVQEGMNLAAVMGQSRVMHVRYEDLVSSPDNTLREIMKFLELPYEDKMLRYHETRQAKNLARFSRHVNVTRPVNAGSIGRYKQKMNSASIQKFERTAGHGLAATGYEVNYENLIMPTRRELFFDHGLRLWLGLRLFVRLLARKVIRRPY